MIGIRKYGYLWLKKEYLLWIGLLWKAGCRALSLDKVPRGSSDLALCGALRRPRHPQSDATGPRKWQGGLKNGPF